MADKYVRFVTSDKDHVTGLRVGFFQAAYELLRSERLPDPEGEALREELDWFREKLATPGRFHRSSNADAHGKGLSWFKPGAVEHISRARRMVGILARNGVAAEMLTSSRPGYVLFEDEYQVCAIPFADRA